MGEEMTLHRKKTGNPMNLLPGDELTVTVDRPMLVSIVNEIDESIAQVDTMVEWGTAQELRNEIQMLRSHIKHLEWRLESQVEERDGERYEGGGVT